MWSDKLRLSLAVSSLFLTFFSSADASVWSGMGENEFWSTPLNWADSPPVSTNSAEIIFGRSSAGPSINDFSGNFMLSSLIFTNNSGSVSLSGNPIELYYGVKNLSDSEQTIGTDIILAADITWEVDGGDVHVTSAINGPDFKIFKTGEGSLFLDGGGVVSGDVRVKSGGVILNGATASIGWIPDWEIFSGHGAFFAATNGASVVFTPESTGKYATWGKSCTNSFMAASGSLVDFGGRVLNMNGADGKFVVSGQNTLALGIQRFFIGFGSGASRNGLIVRDGAKLVCDSQQSYVGDYDGSSSNSLEVSGTGTVLDMGQGTISVGANGSAYNVMRIYDHAVVSNMSLTVLGESNWAYADTGAYVICRGNTIAQGYNSGIRISSSFWDCGCGVLTSGHGNGYTNNTVIVEDGSVVTNVGGNACLGAGTNGNASHNRVIVKDSSIYAKALKAGVGTGASDNSLFITNSLIKTTEAIYIASAEGAVSNSIKIAAGSTWEVGPHSFFLGSTSSTGSSCEEQRSYNSLLIDSGACAAQAKPGPRFVIGMHTNADCNVFSVSENAAVELRVKDLQAGCYGTYAGGNSNVVESASGTISISGSANIGTGSVGNRIDIYGEAAASLNNVNVGLSGGRYNSISSSENGLINISGTLNVGSETSCGNSIRLRGGEIRAKTLNIAANNRIEVQLTEENQNAFHPISVSGDAVLAPDVIILAEADGSVGSRVFEILTAAGHLTADGILLETASGQEKKWFLEREGGKISLRYRETVSIVILR